MGKATSFVDPEGDGDVMPKLVDMLTKVGKNLTFVQHLVNVFQFIEFLANSIVHAAGWS